LKRFVSGIILVVLGILGLIGSHGRDSDSGMGAFIIISGIVLIYFGYQWIDKGKQTTTLALNMIRDNGKIDAAQLAQQMGLSEIDVRIYIAEAQRKGIITFKAEIT